MERAEWDALRRRLDEAGVPEWVPLVSSDPPEERFYVWVDDDGAVRSSLVDDAGRGACQRLLETCREQLARTGERRPGTPPPDLHEPTAVLCVGQGHGPLHREVLRPLVELLRVAEEELERLSQRE